MGTANEATASKSAEVERGAADLLQSITNALSLAPPEKLAPLQPEKANSRSAAELSAEEVAAMSHATMLIASFENLSLNAYPDPKTKNDPVRKGEPITIGFGTTRYTDGKKIKMGDRITAEQATSYLQNHITQKVLPRVRRIPGWAKMSAWQKSALISFAYNSGENFYGPKKFKSITAALKAEKWKDIPQEMMKYKDRGRPC